MQAPAASSNGRARLPTYQLKVTPQLMIGGMTALVLMLRPSIFQAYGELTYVAFVGFVGLFFLLGFKGTLTPPVRRFIIGTGALCAYFLFQSSITSGVSPAVVIKDILFILIPAFLTILITPTTWETVLRVIIYSVVIFVPTYLITGTLIFIGIPDASLLITDFIVPMGEKQYIASLHFPYSIGIGGLVYIEALDVRFPRATGYMREPGIFQILAIVAFFAVDFVKIRFRRLLQVLFAITLLLTFSTAGWGGFLVACIYYYVFAGQAGASSSFSLWKRLAGIVMLIPVGYFVIFSDTYGGLMEKLQYGSGTERILDALIALEALASNPILGVGYRNSAVTTIHFLGSLAQIGAVGALLLFGAVLFGSIDLVRKRHRVLVFLIPILATTIASQPLFDKPLFWAMVGITVAYPRTRVRTEAPPGAMQNASPQGDADPDSGDGYAGRHQAESPSAGEQSAGSRPAEDPQSGGEPAVGELRGEGQPEDRSSRNGQD